MAWWLECSTFRHFGWVRNPLKHFCEIFGAKEQKEKSKISRKCRKKSKNLGKNIGKNRKNEILVEISYQSPPITDISAEISEILFHDTRIMIAYNFFKKLKKICMAK